MDGDASGVVAEFNRLLEAIPYDDYLGAARKAIKTRRPSMDAGEWLYRSTLLSYLYGMGLDVEAEPHSGRGRADMRVKFMNRVWIMELKIARGKAEAKKLADDAMRQIIETGYANRYRDAVLLALAIDEEQRGITEYRAEMRSNAR
ncbi:MAG: PD-(D/E)XK nuclease domain-containing protein [Synergistaceae bacterium]|jgi:hypothetical protein|nr:PD-(D/E)XK nuclease domain-containing protein [Synergistaceae bacterium]